MINLENDIPAWARSLAILLFGAGSAKVLAVWLENRRLTKKDYRETLLQQIHAQTERIEDLESCVSGLQQRVGNLRVDVAHLEERLRDEEEDVERLSDENASLRSRLQDCEDGVDPSDPLQRG